MDEVIRKIKAFEYAGVSPEVLKPYAIGAFVALFIFYLLRFGRRKVVVTSGPIWSKVASRRRLPLSTILSFLFQIIIFGAMFSALTDPRDKASPTIRQVVAVVIDGSGSMATLEDDASDAKETPAEKKTRMALAKEEARPIVEKISGGDLGMILLAGESTKVLSPLQGDGDSLSNSIDEASVDFGPSDLSAATSLAVQAMQAVTDGDVRRHLFIITDDPKSAEAIVTPEGIKRHIINVGANKKNAAVLDIIARPAPVLEGGYDLLVKVKSYSKEPLKGVLKLATDKHSVGQIPIYLPAFGEFVKEYQLAESASLSEGMPLGAYLQIPGDGITLDNQAFTMLPATKRAKVILVTSGNRFLELALQLNPEVSLDVVAPSAYTGVSGTNTLVIFDRTTPETLPPKSILIEPSGNLSPFRIKKRIPNPRLSEWNADSSILRNALAKDIHIEEASVFVPDRADVRLMGLPEGPVALLRESEDRFLLAFGFDFTRSDLVLRIAFPVMLRNALLRAMGWETSDAKRTLPMAYRVGEVFPLEPNAQFIDAAANVIPKKRLGGIDVVIPMVAGVYQTKGEDGKTKLVAVNLGEYEESNISKTEATEHKAAVAELRSTLDHESREPRRPYWVYLILAAIALALIDWMLYHGRVVY
jgi:hypothetical protein